MPCSIYLSIYLYKKLRKRPFKLTFQYCMSGVSKLFATGAGFSIVKVVGANLFYK